MQGERRRLCQSAHAMDGDDRSAIIIKRTKLAARVLISVPDADTDTDTGAEMQIQMEIQIQIEIQILI